jgi:UDP-GlcNAc:undecaprenyl-phosphate/decaprenyl-phosphate GlcNAc-1-phosphate transferase
LTDTDTTLVMIYALISIAMLVSLAVTAALMPAVRRWAISKGWVDCPDGERKLHREPIPAVGGLAMAVGVVIGFLFLMAVEPLMGIELNLPPIGLWTGALLMFCVGFFDDVRGMNFKVKFLFQLAAAYMLLHAGFRVDLSGLAFFADGGYAEALYSIPLTLLWVVGIINAINLIDGLDGLAGGVALIALIALATIFGMHGEMSLVIFALPVIGAIVGFLVHNFNPASVFMGDSGSLVLGFMIAAYSLQMPIHGDPGIALLIPVVALGLPVMDTGLSVFRRMVERKAVCAPDHDHIHHRLTRLWSVRRSVITLYFVSAWFASAAVMMSMATAISALLILTATLAAAILGLRTLGYLRIRQSIATWKAVTIEQRAHQSLSSNQGYSRPRPVILRSSEVRISEKSGRPTIDLERSSDAPHASAA